jgi:hypothetical protein
LVMVAGSILCQVLFGKDFQRISVAGFARRFVRTKYRGGGDLSGRHGLSEWRAAQ